MSLDPLKGLGARRTSGLLPKVRAFATVSQDPDDALTTVDSWMPQAPHDSVDAPFWIIQMHRDQTLKRQWLNARERTAAHQVEAHWINEWVHRIDQTTQAPNAPGTVGEWQALIDTWQDQAGTVFSRPRVVFQKAISPLRAQFLFRVEQHLVQLNPFAKGSDCDRLTSASHELFHHVQQCLINALYQGTSLTEPWMQLARYYRDARIRYIPWHASHNERTHHQQDLEKGAVRFADTLAQSRITNKK